MTDATFLNELKDDQDLKSLVVGMLAQNYSQEDWKGVMSVPEGSIMDEVMSAFRDKTDLPLELIFFSMLHFISGYLLSKKVIIEGKFGECYTELWGILLADSGTGKSLSFGTIESGSSVKNDFPEPVTPAGFIESFQDHNFGLCFIDEISLLMEKIEKGNSDDLKKYLLCAYTNQRIQRKVKGDIVTIDTPCVSILGLNTPKAFFDTVSLKSLLDGFSSRFFYIIVKKDAERDVYVQPEKYAIYDLQVVKEAVQNAFGRLYELPIYERYTVSDDGLQAYTIAFASLINRSIPIAFFRRVLQRSFKFALMYHLLLGKESNIIDGEDIAWACRLANRQLQDLKHILSDDEQIEDMNSLLQKAQKVKTRLEEKGRPFNARVLQQNVRGLDSSTAKTIFDLLQSTKTKHETLKNVDDEVITEVKNQLGV